MRFARTLVYSITLFLLIQSSCKSPTEATVFQDSHIVGRIVRSDDNSGIPGAVVRDLTFTNVADTTNSSGDFDLLYSLDSKLNTRITAVSTGFVDHANDTISVSLDPGQTLSGVGVILGVDSSSPPPGSGYSGIAASIVQVATGPTNISLRGTGSNETTVLTWEVRDSLGFPVTLANKVTVRFSILGGPGGGEYLLPNSVDSDSKGRVSTRLNSGTTAGVVQVYATTRGDTVQSGPTKVTISTGLPDQAHFSMTASTANLPGGTGLPNGDNQKATLTILAGDRFGNPAQAGTAIYFTTNGGVVQSTATTGSSGTATAELSTGNPRPAGGVATVTARTIGDSGAVVTTNLSIVFSGATTILVPSTAFAIPDSGSYTLNYQVQDQNGNPLVKGTSIKVSVSGAGSSSLQLEKDVDVTLPDTRDTNFTNFSVRIVDKFRGGAGGQIVVKIEVNSPNNSTGQVESKTVQGLVLSSGGGGGGGGVVVGTPTADRIGIVSVSKSSIIVNDGSASDKSLTTVTFDVRDSVGNLLINPLNPSAAKVYVTFVVDPSDGVSGGERLLTLADSTNEFAQVTTRLLAGTKSGIFTIKATTLVAGKPPITASTNITIRSGPPDPAHFAVAPDRYNFPVLEKTGESFTNTIVVSLADIFSNPIEAGTQVYFDATNLSVDPVALTNSNGFGQVKMYAGGKKPMGVNLYPGLSPGFMRLRARTVNLETGAEIRDSLLLLVSGQPVITNTTVGLTTYLIGNSGSAGPWTFTVTDQLGNPLSAGTSISAGAPGGAVDGANLTLPDTRTGGPRITTFTINLRDADPTTLNAPPTQGFLTVIVTHPVYGTFSLDLASGSIQ